MGEKIMEEVGRQVLTNAQPAMQPGLWGGTEVRKALSKGDGEVLVRRGQLENGNPSAAGPRMPVIAVSPWTHHCWGGTRSVCRGGGVTPNKLGVQLLVPISSRCSGRSQATAWGTN